MTPPKANVALGRAEAEANRNAQAGYGLVLGFIELSLGDAAAALAHLRRTYATRNRLFMREPGVRLELGDLLEALIAVGELDEAMEVLATWEPRAAALERAWALAILARCRALLLAARGDLEGAFVSFDRALSEHARCGTDPFHHARTLLALGRTQRRAKQRGAARVTLDDTLARFERLGAPLWAEQTRAEMARIGGRAPSRGELKEAERRIARLVAEGRTNREVAAALFLTEHSVETALSRVYQKLGVRSRTELAHQLDIKQLELQLRRHEARPRERDVALSRVQVKCIPCRASAPRARLVGETRLGWSWRHEAWQRPEVSSFRHRSSELTLGCVRNPTGGPLGCVSDVFFCPGSEQCWSRRQSHT